jgi:hypothetical protein
MSRLTHSIRAFLKSMQMSRVELFVFVEGKADRYFYERVCSHGHADSGVTYQVKTADELAIGTVGKTALLDFFTYLRDRKLLAHSFKGKKLAALFIADKDVDDFLRTYKKSIHLIYTEFYHRENYPMRYSDLADVAADAASLDVPSVHAVLGNQDLWRRRAASEWKEWIKLCLVARRTQANCPSNYSQKSQINNGPYGGVDQTRLANSRAALETASGLPTATFQRLWARVDGFVERMLKIGQHDRLFKGTWYASFLVEDISLAAAGRAYKSNGLEARLMDTAVSKLDFAGSWAYFFFGGFAQVINQLQNGAIKIIP